MLTQNSFALASLCVLSLHRGRINPSWEPPRQKKSFPQSMWGSGAGCWRGPHFIPLSERYHLPPLLLCLVLGYLWGGTADATCRSSHFASRRSNKHQTPSKHSLLSADALLPGKGAALRGKTFKGLSISFPKPGQASKKGTLGHAIFCKPPYFSGNPPSFAVMAGWGLTSRGAGGLAGRAPVCCSLARERLALPEQGCWQSVG